MSDVMTTTPDTNAANDGLAQLAHALFGRDALPSEWLGGSEAKILYAAASAIRQHKARIDRLEKALKEIADGTYFDRFGMGATVAMASVTMQEIARLALSPEGEGKETCDPNTPSSSPSLCCASSSSSAAQQTTNEPCPTPTPSPTAEQLRERANIDQLRQQAQWYGTRNPALRDLLLWAADALTLARQERDAAVKVIPKPPSHYAYTCDADIGRCNYDTGVTVGMLSEYRDFLSQQEGTTQPAQDASQR